MFRGSLKVLTLTVALFGVGYLLSYLIANT